MKIDNGPRTNMLVGAITGEVSKTSGPAGKMWLHDKVGILVVHCQESERMDWLHEDFMPSLWKVRVYEKCGQNSTKWSTSLPNYGSEECTAYLRYIIDEFDDLPDVNYFLQADALIMLKPGTNDMGGHTPFDTLEDLINTTLPLMNHPGGGSNLIPFLHLSPMAISYWINLNNIPLVHVYVPEILRRSNVTFDNDTIVNWHAGACFAVRKEQILEKGKDFFQKLHDLIAVDVYKNGSDVREACWSLEATWPQVFGVPVDLPKEATVMHYMGGRSPYIP
jgi:Protein of unknown function (DUF3431)